jgi:excisionase family DNA binding protein
MQTHSLETPALLNEPEAARLLKVSQRNLIRLRNRGAVPYYRIGKSVRYSREKLLAAIEVEQEEGYAHS